ncbi:MAG: 1-acyl-sn-glycerol-3-phosphate acyltransferase [Crocinitomicaceae bacterium]|nr:1-acyl-sn-glycerol-3-phosphate acyltransferase [Crocinitomicaceae bacterium]
MHPSPVDVNNFDDVRPLTDDEIPPAIERLLTEPVFFKMMKWVYPSLGKKVILEMMREITTVNDFQEQVSAPAFKVVTQLTTSGLSFTNMESLKKEGTYLFISNHRDIILDSALLNVSLMEKGYKTTQIAIGDNLLKTQSVRDLVRANKNFIVNRNVSPKDIFHYSLRLSNYIRKTIIDDQTSIWIAQREGRSKDGDDRTSSALLKMFAMSETLPMEDALLRLNIIPMAVSYEYDPCDLMKASELIQLRLFGTYEKKQGEDFRSMLRGLTGHKGHVNIAVGSPVEKYIEEMRRISHKNEKVLHLAHSIDSEMHRIYKLWPTNYIAYDLLYGTREFKEYYSNIKRITFSNYIRGHVIRLGLLRKKMELPKEGFSKAAREILLEMYANPVVNKKNVEFSDRESISSSKAVLHP